MSFHLIRTIFQSNGTEMFERLRLYRLVYFGSLCLVFLLFNQRNSYFSRHQQQRSLSVGRYSEEVETKPQFENLDLVMLRGEFNKSHYHKYICTTTCSMKIFAMLWGSLPHVSRYGYIRRANHNDTLIIQQVIDQQRKLIEYEMRDYKFPNNRNYNVSATRLQDLLMEKGGTPVRSIVLTSWRSGSTFFGDILNAHPANFYHYEPLIKFGIVQVRGAPIAKQALMNIKAFLNCEYENKGDYLNYAETHSWVFSRNTELWKQCKAHKNMCSDPQFVSGFCKLFPFQSMKIVRLRLAVAEELLADKKLSVRLVLLVRDPRGTLQSRKHRDWCRDVPDCSDPQSVCEDMLSDFNAALRLREKYPNRFKVIRYEDLSVEPHKHAEELYKFYGIDFYQNAADFLDTHTKHNAGGASSTFRNSSATPFHWRTDLKYEEVEEIQRSCTAAMRHWGYVPAMNATHQKEFNPVTDYELEL